MLAKPVNADVALPGIATEPPAPDMMVQEPTPLVGALAASTVEVPQSISFGPALAGVVGVVKLMITSSVLAAHGALEVVQRNVYDVPWTPEKLDPALVGVAIVPPAPEMMLQRPVPEVGVLAANVADEAQRF